MSHLKLVSSTTPPDSTAYSEALEQLDAGLCIIDGDVAVMANNQAFCRLLGLPSDWASPKAAKRTVPASEQLVTGWLARIASEGGARRNRGAVGSPYAARCGQGAAVGRRFADPDRDR